MFGGVIRPPSVKRTTGFCTRLRIGLGLGVVKGGGAVLHGAVGLAEVEVAPGAVGAGAPHEGRGALARILADKPDHSGGPG